ncbi:hypothetical protein RvY_05617 [Ramazzottius varieornatus]|uniref:Uncharacterized protein n=1 Tax=Ramazzottius varieornatus TaxID=947166 RepID=A0A1D1V4N8_RAMVA|nr:hypothetical protein RvY_05617 [Ramazzottius varieornatus]
MNDIKKTKTASPFCLHLSGLLDRGQFSPLSKTGMVMEEDVGRTRQPSSPTSMYVWKPETKRGEVFVMSNDQLLVIKQKKSTPIPSLFPSPRLSGAVYK